MVSPTEYVVSTTFGGISVWDSRGKGPVALLIHGNSACGRVFEKQFASEMRTKFRLIAMDLPGHGSSENAINPEETYSFLGYANVAIAVLRNLGVPKASVIGWSLGGHIAIDMLRFPEIQGILITGTPPIPLTAEGFKQGFRPFAGLHLLGQESFSEKEAKEFVALGGIDLKNADFMVKAALRTHGKARSQMIASMQRGVGGDQKQIVEGSDKPIAIVAGSRDAGINNDYIQTGISHKSLWGRKIHLVEAGHAVFWEQSEKFNRIVFDFLTDVNQLEPSSIPLKRVNRKIIASFTLVIAVAIIAHFILTLPATMGANR